MGADDHLEFQRVASYGADAQTHPGQNMRVVAVYPDITSAPVDRNRLQMTSLEQLGVDVMHIIAEGRRSAPGLLSFGLSLRSTVREKRADLVHAHWGSSLSLACVLFSPVPTVVSICGSDLLGNYNKRGQKTLSGRVSTACSQLSGLWATACVAKSEGLRRSLWAASQHRCAVIPNGIQLDLFRPEEQALARRRLRWLHDDPVVLFLNRKNAYVKAPELGQAAYEVARAETCGLRLEVVENQPFERMADFYNAADVLLLTSRHEGSSNAVKEALACNLPVVATRCGDTQERLAGVYPSEVCDSDSVALGKAVARIAAMRSRSNGRESVEDLSEENVARRLLALYTGVLRDQKS